MTFYSRVGECDLIDSFVFRHAPNWYGHRVFGLLLPFGRRALLLYMSFRPGRHGWRLTRELVYMRRSDAMAAAMKKHEERAAAKERA